MATSLSETEQTAAVEPRSGPDETALQDRLPAWFGAPRVLAGYTLVLGLVHLFLSHRPLWHTDLWGHLAYGRWIWQHKTLPETAPLLPLAEGMPFVDSAWLSQWIGYGIFQLLGVPGLQFLYAAAITCSLALLAWCCYRRTANAWLSLAGLAVFLWVDWQQLLIVRPQLAGLVCFVLLFALLSARRWSRSTWIVMPALFAVWANLHGSVIVGLAALGAFCVGRACDVLRRTGRIAAVWRDRRVRRAFLLTELAAVAVLANPYGLELYAAVLSFPQNANLSDLIEWQPLTLRMKQGQAAAVTALALVVVYRFSPRRVSATEFLLLAGLGAGALWYSRMILWWAPVAAYYLVLHGQAAWRRWRRDAPLPGASSESRGLWAVATLGIVWIVFALTPLGMALLHGSQAELRASVSARTPVGAAEYLREHPPKGQVFNSYEWGDYLLWAGPEDIEVFVASHAHLVPREVWQAYMRIVRLGDGWRETLDRFGVNTIVLDRPRREALIERLRTDESWKTVYEDERSIIFVRRATAPPVNTPSARAQRPRGWNDWKSHVVEARCVVTPG